MGLVSDLGVGPVTDVGLLDSAIHRPQAHVFGLDPYPKIYEKAAVLLESLVLNHALVDGNKRLGWMAIFVFFGLNGFTLDAPDDDAYELVIGVTTRQIGYQESARRLSNWAVDSGAAPHSKSSLS